MTINEQKAINEKAVDVYSKAMAEYQLYNPIIERLRTCTATVESLPNYKLLRSYSTIVAVIDYSDGICYDVLRYVYGYTATSAMHISKFANDYGNGNKLTWRYVK